MQLVADRFVVDAGGAAIDLATGEPVHLVIDASPPLAAAWASRCARLAALRHWSIAPLLDYGALDRTRRFEAWGCGTRWGGAQAAADATTRAAAAFLRSLDLTGDSSMTVHRRGRSPVVVLPPAAGYDVDIEVDTASVERSEVDCGELNTQDGGHGTRLIGRPAVTALCELFAEPATRPRVLALWAPTGSGATTAIRTLARAARMHGHVPVSTGLGAQLRAVVAQRTLLLIAPTPADGWRHALWSVLQSARPHIVLIVGEHEIHGVPTLHLDDVSVERLLDAVLPRPESGSLSRLRRAATAAKGHPACFARELASRVAAMGHVNARNVDLASRAAERQPAYAASGASAVSIDTAPVRASTKAPDVEALIVRLDQAVAALAAGRHASGDRVLRQAVAALARRRCFAEAARGAVALAESLTHRGRMRDSTTVLQEARTWAMQAGADVVLAGAAVAAGTTAIQDARLQEAETMLRVALTSAQGLGATALADRARLMLAHSLFWRGQFRDAERLLTNAGPTPSEGTAGRRNTNGAARANDASRAGDASSANDASSEIHEPNDEVAVRTAAAKAAIYVGLRQLAEATAASAEAVRRARLTGRAGLVAEAAWSSAFVHLALGDYGAAGQDAAESVAAAKRGRDPLLAASARLLAGEALRRAGRRSEAAAQLARVSRMTKAQLPALLRERHALAAELLTPDMSRHSDAVLAAADRRARSTGLSALTLFVPAAGSASSDFSTAIADIIEILRCCQKADEDAGVLNAVCATLRGRLRASGVAVFVEDAGLWVPVAGDGARLDPSTAKRIGTMTEPVPPHRIDERIEGGAAIRYAGRIAGALAVRWTVGTSCDIALSTALLSAAATAIGPATAAVARVRASSTSGVPWELIGASGAMEEVRRAVERAAAAPFSVLIEGESGCGKELVARALHRRGPRRDRPFCPVNCAALPDDLIESELFGHARGAFTGAVAERLGVFEEAHGGTLFLDEIGELSTRAQAKVLRAIQEGEIRRVGDNVPRRVDVRLVAATNRDLRQEVAAGRFRLDLLYRLDVIRIAVPALRERRDDIPILAEHFWREAATRIGSHAVLGGAVLAALARYDWPGNVRELQNVLSALAVRTPKRGVVQASALPPPFDASRPSGPESSWRLDAARRTFEQRFIRAALARAGGHRARAAAELGVTRQGLTKLMSRLGIDHQL